MAFDMNNREPHMVSYLDLLVLSGEGGFNVSKNLEAELEQSGNRLFGLPELPEDLISKGLEDMGMDLGSSVETRVCIHKPKILALQSEVENTPSVYGTAYFGYLKEDRTKFN